MAKKNKGFVAINRSLLEHWIWTAESFTKGQAWVDLILLANHEEKKIMISGQLKVIKAGQMWTSYRTLAERWGWSINKVLRYTKMLKSDGMIYTDGTPNGTLLTLVNYDKFSIRRNTQKNTDGYTDEYAGEETDEETGGEQTTMINNVNNDKQRRTIPRFARDPVEDY